MTAAPLIDRIAEAIFDVDVALELERTPEAPRPSWKDMCEHKHVGPDAVEQCENYEGSKYYYLQCAQGAYNVACDAAEEKALEGFAARLEKRADALERLHKRRIAYVDKQSVRTFRYAAAAARGEVPLVIDE